MEEAVIEGSIREHPTMRRTTPGSVSLHNRDETLDNVYPESVQISGEHNENVFVARNDEQLASYARPLTSVFSLVRRTENSNVELE